MKASSKNIFLLTLILNFIKLYLFIDQQISKKTVRSLAQLYFFFSFYSIVILRLVLYIGEPYGLYWCCGSGYSFQNARFFSLFRKDVFVCVPLPLLCLMLLLLRQSRVECCGSTSHWCLWEFNDRAIFLSYTTRVSHCCSAIKSVVFTHS